MIDNTSGTRRRRRGKKGGWEDFLRTKGINAKSDHTGVGMFSEVCTLCMECACAVIMSLAFNFKNVPMPRRAHCGIYCQTDACIRLNRFSFFPLKCPTIIFKADFLGSVMGR